MRKIKTSILILLLMLALPASADAALPTDVTVIGPQAFLNCTELTGTLVIPDGVTEIGEEAFKGCTGLTGLELPATVTKIGDRAFAGCTALTGTVVGDGVSVGEDAFDGTSVEVVESTPTTDFEYTVNADGTVTITGYIGVSEDATIVIPGTIEGGQVTEIGASAFSGQLMKVVILPDALLTIGESAFERCTRLTAVRGGRHVTSYGANAFWHCIELSEMTINEDAAVFGEYAFYDCAKLSATLSLSAGSTFDAWSFYGSDVVAFGFVVNGETAALKQRFGGGTPREHVTIPSSYKGLPVTEIVDSEYGYAHDGPAYHITIPGTVQKIGYAGMYHSNDALVHVDFEEPSGLVEIGDMAFFGLNNLERVDLPASLKHIGNDVFKHDVKLKELTLPSGLETLGESSFWFTIIPSIDIPESWTELPPYAFYGMALTEFTIPERITKLGQAALAETDLTSLIIPETVTEVGAYTFAGCEYLTEAVLPQHLMTLPSCAFMNCTSLTRIDLPDSITSIDIAAFQGCTSLEYVELPPNLTYVLTCVFEDCGVRTKAVERVVSECITDDMSEFEKALALHDWLINNADYSSYRTFFGAEGVLVYGEGVCQSYTDAYAMLLDQVGISHQAVVSSSMDHAWNLVQLDGEWYHIDVTWDDPVGGTECHTYFGLTDELMSADHTWDNADSLPAATGTRYQYGVDNGN